MIFLKFYFTITTLFISCKDVKQNQIEIIGKADNSKGGAVVVSNQDNKVYFLDGFDSWNEKIYGKTIKVKGKLLIKKIKEIPKQLGLPIPQQMIGTKRTILEPNWELIK